MVALLAFTVFLPVFLLIAGLLWVAHKGNPFFLQVRPGKNERLFRIIKFKTMTNARDKEGNLLPDSERLTTAGKFIRRTSLDEIPQLLNVLKGDMSLVGPRPEVPEYVRAYPERDRETVLSVRPGLTDYAALEFKKESELLDEAHDPERVYLEEILPQKLALYRSYVENAGLATDVALILRTVKALLAKGE